MNASLQLSKCHVCHFNYNLSMLLLSLQCLLLSMSDRSILMVIDRMQLQHNSLRQSI